MPEQAAVDLAQLGREGFVDVDPDSNWLVTLCITAAAGDPAGHAQSEHPFSFKHLRAPETKAKLVCRHLLEKKKEITNKE